MQGGTPAPHRASSAGASGVPVHAGRGWGRRGLQIDQQRIDKEENEMKLKRKLKQPWWKGAGSKTRGKGQQQGNRNRKDTTHDSRMGHKAKGSGRKHAETRESLSIEGPTKLNLGSNYDEVAEFIKEIHALPRKYVEARISLEKTQELDLGGILVFAAALEILNLLGATDRKGERWKVSIEDPSSMHRGVLGVLHDFGVHQLIQPKTRIIDQRRQTAAEALGLSVLQVQRGREADGRLVKRFVEDKLEKLIEGRPEKRYQLIGAITEAITNVGEHAYKPETKGHHWWVSAAYHKTSGQLTVAVYDHGQGIPTTLRRKYVQTASKTVGGMNPLRRMLRLNDGQMIAKAHRLDKSRTKLKNRGKGLRWDMQAYLENISGQGSYRVTSGFGQYEVVRGITAPLEPKWRELGTELQGTLVEWEIQIGGRPNQ